MDWLRVIKFIFFFLLGVIVVPLTLFMQITFDWWIRQYYERRVVFYLLAIIYAPLGLLYNFAYESWTALAD